MKKPVDEKCANCKHYWFKNLEPYCFYYETYFPNPRGGLVSKGGDLTVIKPAGLRSCSNWDSDKGGK
jgi:hypothetical protein